MAQLVKNLPTMRETWVCSLIGKIPWRREKVPIPVFWPGQFHGLYSVVQSVDNGLCIVVQLSNVQLYNVVLVSTV